MAASGFRCSECGWVFRTEAEGRDRRMLMCPSCGSYDLQIFGTDGQVPVLRAKPPAAVGTPDDLRRPPDS
jgi:Zn finger protein HypA/HybF involved in hydrogenase expression